MITTFATKYNGLTMPEISSDEAARLIGVSDETIRRLVNRKVLPARQVGLRRTIRIELDALRQVAVKLDYRFDEEAARRFADN